MIISFGTDKRGKLVNWGSPVDKGTILAKIDDSLYMAAVKSAEGQVQQAEASVVVSKANVLQQKASLLLATQNWERAKRLGPSDALSQSAYDQYRETFDAATANLASAEAAVEQALASVDAAQGDPSHSQDEPRLLHDQIPGQGHGDRQAGKHRTDRRLLADRAEPLPHRERPEAHPGMDLRKRSGRGEHRREDKPVTFTVDAFPGRIFHGGVGQVRLNATMTQNVVTYTIEVDIDNSDGKLLPTSPPTPSSR